MRRGVCASKAEGCVRIQGGGVCHLRWSGVCENIYVRIDDVRQPTIATEAGGAHPVQAVVLRLPWVAQRWRFACEYERAISAQALGEAGRWEDTRSSRGASE
jgi:hypothetical protein